MRIFRSLGVLLLLALCAGQVAAQQATVEPTPQEPQLRAADLLQDDSLISGQPCGAPCWRGITPGKTAWDDALAIVNGDATLENVNVQNDTQSPAKLATFQQKGGETCCRMFTQDGATVTYLFLRIAPDLTLGQVINVHGEPTYALGSQFSDTQAILNMLFPEKAMFLYAYVAGTQADLSANSEVIGMLYVTPEYMDTTVSQSNLYRWKGYQNYQTYSDQGPNFDSTPAVSPPTPEVTTSP